MAKHRPLDKDPAFFKGQTVGGGIKDLSSYF